MKIMKVLLIGVLSFTLMGVDSCTGDDPKERYLRLSADVGPVKGQIIKMPDGRIIDFPYIANALFYYALMRDPHFIIDRPIQIGYPVIAGRQKTSLYVESDDSLLARYGFFKHSVSSFAKAKEVPKCLDQSPEIRLSGNVISFELIAGGGIHAGYPGGGSPLPVGGSLSLNNTRLSVTLQSEDPLTKKPIAIDEGHASEVKLDGSFDYMGFIGLDFFFKTPLFKVVTNAFQESIDNLVNTHMTRMNVEKWTDVWQSKVIFDSVIADGDTHIAVRGGWRSNIRKGDQFSVYNMHYKWVGIECESPLDYSISHPLESIAEVIIVEAGQDIAIARVTKASQDYRIDPGALVKIKELAN
ncbi:MAG: hypothetical protein SGJ18_01720 [Pseudomonadota bacterium]|nr:hypothetical protein [Pseudomonadota bacterium]